MEDIKKLIEELQFLETTLLKELKNANNSLADNLGKVETIILKVQNLLEHTEVNKKKNNQCDNFKKIMYFIYFLSFISFINLIFLFFML
jgi:hypothetical protein